MLSLKQELESRGLLKQYTDEKLFELYDQGGQKFYFGMDPTADSLHLGNFVNFMNAVHLMRKGNTCIPLIGGATGMIGDPGGKDSERSFLDEDTLAHNVTSIQNQINTLITNIKSVLGEDLPTQPVVNNKDFYDGMGFIDFLREAGKYITVNSMLTKETVRKRIEDPDKSISYTEFSYMLIQGYDFYKLYADQGVKLQIAGSDQWGNVTTGIEIIRKKTDGGEAYAFTCPLVLDSNGKKFGKSEGNAIWLDRSKNSPYFVYQYFLNVADADVERFLKLFTFYDFDTIDQIVATHNTDSAARHGQIMLAEYVVKLIFGPEAASLAQKITNILNKKWIEAAKIIEKFSSKDIDALVDATSIKMPNPEYIPEKTRNENEINQQKNLKDIDNLSSKMPEPQITDDNNFDLNVLYSKGSKSIIELLFWHYNISSKKEAKKLILGGGVYVNDKRVESIEFLVSSSDAVNGVVILKKGKIKKVVRVG